MPDVPAVTSTPASSAAPSSSSGSSSPAPAPTQTVTPSAQPAAGGGAGETASPSTPPATEGKTLPPGKTQLEIIQEKSRKVMAEAGKEQPAATPVVEPKVEEKKPDAVKVEDAKVEDKAPVVDPDDAPILQDDDLLLEEMGMASPADIAQWKSEIPELAKALDEHPEIQGKLASTLRRAADAIKVKEIVGSERQAKFMVGQTAIMDDIESGFTSIDAKDESGVDGFTKLLGIMGTLDAVRDETTGEILKDTQGNIQRYGNVDKFVHKLMGSYLENEIKAAEASADPSLLAALNVVKERMTGSSSPSDEEMPEHVRAEAEKVRADRQKLDADQVKAKREKRMGVETALRDKSFKFVDGEANRFLDRTSLDKFTRQVVVEKAHTAFIQAIKADPVYQNQVNYLASQPQTKEVQAERLRVGRDAVASKLPGIMRKLMKEAGAQEMKKQSDAETTRTQQEAGSRHDVKGAAADALPKPAATTPKASYDELTNDLKTKLGRNPSTQEYVAEKLRRQQAARSAAS